MENRAIFMICLIAVMAPVYVLFMGALAKNMKDSGTLRNDTHLSKGMMWGMCIGIILGVILGFAIRRTGSAICFGAFAGDIVGALIGGAIGALRDKAEKENEENNAQA